MPEMLTIEVIYALPAKQQLVTLKLPRAARCGRRSRLPGCCRSIRKSTSQKTRSVFSPSSASPTPPARSRPRGNLPALIADPKEVRKQRAAAGKVMKKGAGESEVE
jgi:putative ubiquitin-RnfH superfamily antitoxin RatB of RatAB toxin-antitoxin module